MASQQFGYIGLGAMGKNMASHIAKKVASLNHPPLMVYNRTQARAEEFAKTQPAKVAASLEDIAKSCSVIFSCLLNDGALYETISSLKPHLKRDTVIVESSTVSPALAKDLTDQMKQIGVVYLACPVMGPPVKAASGDLTVLMAGGKKVIELGYEDVRESLRLKLCGNFLVTSVVEMIAEGMTLGEASGVGQDKVKELIDCVFPNSLLSVYSERMLKNTYRDQVAFAISGAKKDAGHIMHMAQEVNAKLPITEIFLEHANQTQSEQGDIDMSGIVGIYTLH
ncbi:hypothetical protein A0J61_06214 [Choanephora cucurbitarum]|uniref:Oxidoreductase YfjR n=1 Tax=Choanephora cucurbitarum TaxID=101091 RepID=A0A1C7NEF2_9FUNG|nr:hypothetical protein A0J61_06214 [Choanephora cucurbitarum]